MGAENAIQKMIAHQIATGHTVAMKLFASAQHRLAAYDADATRMVMAAARLMESVARGARVLDGLQHGGRQHVTVQYVAVADGGQAVVAGNVGRQPLARLSQRGSKAAGGEPE